MGGDISLSARRRGRAYDERDYQASLLLLWMHSWNGYETTQIYSHVAVGSNDAKHAATYLPHVGVVDLAHGVPVEAAASIDDGLDLVAARHILVDLEADVARRLECR